MTTRPLTIKYWRSLSEGSRRRALTYVFPQQQGLVDMLISEEPDKKDPWWQIVFRKVRIPDDNSHYKTEINQIYIP